MGKSSRARLAIRPACSVEAAVSLIDGKWKCVLLWHLSLKGTLRFSELRRCVPGATQRVITHQLRELEEDGLVHRKVYAQVPPKVEYSLTARGTALEPVLAALRHWGDTNLPLLTSDVSDPPGGKNGVL